MVMIGAVVGVVAYEYFVGTSNQNTSVTIQGAGATFPAPLIQNWTVTYHNLYSNVTINYNSVGSTAGRQLITNKTVDFGASDAPLTDAQIVAAPGLILFPETLGGVAITFNVPTIASTTHLNFTGEILVEIYNGTITNWNDARIGLINGGVTLPNQAIYPVHRADGSGTTYAFKDYLSHVDAWWNNHVPVDTSATWPVAGQPSGQGNAGVASYVSNNQGAIGYVDVIYAVNANLGFGAVLNRDGSFITPTLQSITYAAANETVISPTDLRQHIVNAHGPQSYPIATYTYIMVYKEMSTNPHTSKNAAYALAKFFWWIVGSDGQSKAPGLIYAKLPSNVVSADQTLLRSLTWAGQQIITS